MLKEGENMLAVVAIRWSDGSFLEDQDHWWLSGIHRSVEIQVGAWEGGMGGSDCSWSLR